MRASDVMYCCALLDCTAAGASGASLLVPLSYNSQVWFEFRTDSNPQGASAKCDRNRKREHRREVSSIRSQTNNC